MIRMRHPDRDTEIIVVHWFSEVSSVLFSGVTFGKGSWRLFVLLLALVEKKNSPVRYDSLYSIVIF